ncbi:MAG: MASE1 domain-containing protein [Myxococcales bacterium]|nr:MASE1 domain-containing protein [Myxococcales bacterium]
MGAHLAEPLPAQAPRGLARATSRRAWLARAALVGAAYVVSGRLGLELAHAQDNATLFWPPTGIALAALLALGWRVWPVVALSALGVNLMIGTPPLAALGIAIGNTAEALVAVFLLARMGFRPTFDAHRHVLGLVLAAAVGALVAALVGAGVLYLAGLVALEQTASVALVWWLGDVGGAIVIAPLALLAFSDGASWRALAARAESWIVFGATAASAFVAFGGLVPPAWSLFVAFLPFPFLVWSGLALGPRGAVVNATLVALVAVIGTAKGHGPFVHEEAGVRLMTLWAYVIAMGGTASVLAAAVAERERSEAERRSVEAAQHELEVRMRDKQRLEGLGLLASGVAHDFNNILAAIRVNADLLVGHVDADERPLLDEIDHAVVRAAELCHQLMAYAGRSPSPLGPVELGSVAEDVRRLVSPALRKDVSLEIATPEGLPAALGVASQLRQVLMNLVLNAAEAIGGRGGRVRVSARVERDSILLEVEDDGPGMDEATRARIFDPFFTTKATGRGLGLAAVAGIVKAHGGALEVESRLNVGTTFRIRLQRAVGSLEERSGAAALLGERSAPPSLESPQVASSPPPSLESPQVGSSTPPSLESPQVASSTPSLESPRLASPTPSEEVRRLRVLVADDEAPIREVLRVALALEGHDVETVADGTAAVARASSETFDLVLLDLTMPGCGGAEALAGIRRARPSIHAVLMSGYDESQTPHDEVFLAKPFSITALLAAVRVALERDASPINGTPS